MSDNSWNPPNAPNLKEDFNKASGASSEIEEQDRTPDIATVYEQEWLEEQRDSLALEQHHTIEGTIEHAVNQQVYDELEQRINSIRERREASSQRFRTDFRENSRRR